MALILKDRIKEITNTTGTGDLTLGGSSPAYDTFQSVMTNGDTTYYAIVHGSADVDEWEVGLGTWNTGNTLTRTTVLAGSNGTTAVNFGSGTKEVFITLPADAVATVDSDSNDLASYVTLGNHDTDGLAEGATNLYFTTARIDAHLSGGTGVTYTTGQIDIGQSVGTTDDVTFNTVTAGLTGDVTGNVTGNLTGDVTGDVTGNLTGDVTGNVTGDVTGNVTGNVTGDLTGDVTGNITGNVTGNLDGAIGGTTPSTVTGTAITATTGFSGPLTGNVTGDVTGNVTGNVTGDVTGDLTGNVTGNVTGDVTGDLTGNVTGNVTGDLTGNVTGNVTGDVTGNADTATALQTARSIAGQSFDGTADISISASDLTDVDQALATTSNVTFSDITSTGTVTLAADPTAALGAATKQYVDTIASAGIHYHDPVRVESPIALTVTYDNGTAGVGATLTNAGTQAALVIDGVTLSLNDRVLIYEQTDQTQNGVYTVTDVGSASTNWVLTRSTDTDTAGPSDPNSFGKGDAFFVKEGNTGAGELYVMNTTGTITFGTTNIVFSQVAETAVYSAGDSLTLTGTVFDTVQDIRTTATPTFAGINAPLTGNVTGDVTGDVTGGVTGDVTGNLTGNVTGNVTGDVTGDLTGNVTGNVTGDVTGDLTGNVTGNVAGNVTGDVTGDLTGNVTGDVTGNVTGDVTGDVTGNLTGNVTGDVTGDLTGNVTGDVTGNVTGDLTGDVTGNVTGDLTGNVTGNVTGDLTGDVYASDGTSKILEAGTNGTDATFTGSITGDVTGTVTDVSNHDTDDIAEGATNLYYTSARANADFDTRLATKSTTDLAEGTNLYYTTARFDTAFSGKTTDDLTEGSTNLYYTDARANNAIDTRVDQTFINNLNVDASTVGGQTVGDFDPAGTAVAMAIALG